MNADQEHACSEAVLWPSRGVLVWDNGHAALTANKAVRPRRKTGPDQRSLTYEASDRMSIVAPSPTSVYRYYDRDGVLLYVGITSRAGQRQREHNADKEWWGFVSRQAVDHFNDRPSAARREKEIILRYRPPFNKQHNPDHAGMRAIYLLQAALEVDLKERRRVANEQMPKKARSLLTILENRLPLSLVERKGDLLVYKTKSKHAALVREVDWPDGVILRGPGKIATLDGVIHQGEIYYLRFRVRGNQKVPTGITLKLRNRKSPLGVYAYEAVAS